MTSREILESVLERSSGEGPYSLQVLLEKAKSRALVGIAKSAEKRQEWYILFSEGEPDGAILYDDKGSLFGDKAVYLLKGNEQFMFYKEDPSVIERITLGCRVFDRNLFTRGKARDMPEMKKVGETGAGIFSMKLVMGGNPVQGRRISIRRAGQIIANDTTSSEGKVSFRLLFGKYECVVHEKDLSTRVYEFEFHADLLNQVVTLDIS